MNVEQLRRELSRARIRDRLASRILAAPDEQADRAHGRSAPVTVSGARTDETAADG